MVFLAMVVLAVIYVGHFIHLYVMKCSNLSFGDERRHHIYLRFFSVCCCTWCRALISVMLANTYKTARTVRLTVPSPHMLTVHRYASLATPTVCMAALGQPTELTRMVVMHAMWSSSNQKARIASARRATVRRTSTQSTRETTGPAVATWWVLNCFLLIVYSDCIFVI